MYKCDLMMNECSILVLEGMLCVSSSWRMIGGEEDTFMLWAMKEYGVKESWTQLFKIKFTIFDSAKVIYRFADGDVLFHLSNKTSKGAVALWFDWFDSVSIGHDDNTFEAKHQAIMPIPQNFFFYIKFSVGTVLFITCILYPHLMMMICKNLMISLQTKIHMLAYSLVLVMGWFLSECRSIDQLFLWNPSTRESILLSFPKFRILYSTFGLGYDQTNNDYVVLAIHDGMIDTHPHYGILALKSGYWRKMCTNTPLLLCPTMDRFGFFMDYMTFIHGAFRWIRCNRYVVSLSISNEAHTEIPFPEQMYYYPSNLMTMKECGVSVLEGMLCVSSTWRIISGEDTFMLWAMKGYGVKESWTQLFKINFTPAKPIDRFADNDVLFHGHTEGLILLCKSIRTSKRPVQLWFDWFDSLSIGYDDTFEIITFAESLISPKSLL
ncbi:hypothetical protein H5410_052302 [Solanum commersonii]|uniref:F-box associated beta-propeller type 3 domain-containing protein n=1 Tax=Solanum commersonii TaxID=4109 RepID=A0A9J5X0Q8_SOLCO|nr:hypothetical protein H5410_052302 [Solanum commersonii]